MLVLPSAGTLTRHAISRDLFDGVLVVSVMAHCTERLYAEPGPYCLDLMSCFLDRWTAGLSSAEMSPGLSSCPTRVRFQVKADNKQ